MILADGNPSSGAEVARLADAFDAVPRVLAACAGFPFDETTPVDVSAWTFQGGEFSLLWRDDARSYFGGAETSEESTFAGIAYYVLRPMMERDRLSTRRAALILALRALRDRGSTLADLDAWLSVGDARHVAPSGEQDGSAVIEVPFQLRIHLQILAPFADVG